MTTATKWTATTGPRQTKAINQAFSAVNWEAKTIVELSGVVGNEFRSVVTPMFGAARPDATEGLEDIGNRYEWTLTPENYKRVIAELDTLRRRLEESRPVVDNRRTVAEEAERIDQCKAAEQDRAIEARAKSAEVDRIAAELRAQYPWAKQTGSDHARAAANIKRELSLAFPGVTFRVRSESFSGGDSVCAGWDNGPTTKQVDALLGKYERGSFDSMQDLYEYDHSAYGEAARAWLGSAKYVSSSRSYSDDVMRTTARLLCERQGIQYTEPEHLRDLRNVDHLYGDWDHEDLLTHVWRLLQHVEFPQGFTITGLKRDDRPGLADLYTLELSAPAQPEPLPTGHKCEVQKHYHTKKECDFWLVVMTDRLAENEFEALRDRCKAAGGWYSRKWGKTPGGFAFDTQEEAETFAATV